MTKGIIISLFLLIALSIGSLAFYGFMTGDRSYTWSKEFSDEVTQATEKLNFEMTPAEPVDVASIKLPLLKTIQLTVQKALSKLGLTNYNAEFGEVISLKSYDKKEIINFKAWCLGDYIVGLEIEYCNLDDSTLSILKHDVRQHFNKYKIIWTKI